MILHKLPIVPFDNPSYRITSGKAACRYRVRESNVPVYPGYTGMAV